VSDAGAANTVFVAGTVISHLGASVKIRDVGHQVAIAWNETTGVGRAHRPSACFYDLREGCYQGVIDSATTGTWAGQPVTFITVNQGAFEKWMIGSFVQLGGQSALILMADQPAVTAYPDNGLKRLIVQGTGYSGAAAGAWYTVKGNCGSEQIARCGAWSSDAQHIGGETKFVLSPNAEVRTEQLGWLLQPDIERRSREKAELRGAAGASAPTQAKAQPEPARRSSRSRASMNPATRSRCPATMRTCARRANASAFTHRREWRPEGPTPACCRCSPRRPAVATSTRATATKRPHPAAGTASRKA
jgi:hypothetical protein